MITNAFYLESIIRWVIMSEFIYELMYRINPSLIYDKKHTYWNVSYISLCALSFNIFLKLIGITDNL